MFFTRKNKQNQEKSQEIIRDFKGYVSHVIYRSPEYQSIMMKKACLSIKGYKSHPIYFDIMIKNERNYYIGENRGIIPLNI